MPTYSAQDRTFAPLQPPTDLIARGVIRVRRFLCGLHGHDAVLHFEQRRMSLQCTSCGYETPGWDLNGVPARSEVGHTLRRFPLPLVSQRRVA